MHVRQFYLGCLSHASYLISDDGEAAVVDPQRDVQQYLDAAREQGLRIRWVVETHLHADFVSGHRELAEATGAEIVFGRRAGVAFPHRAVTDGEELALGRGKLRILETPGHTPESICVLVIDETGAPRSVLTGDTLFIGDVGRPDLAATGAVTPKDMAGQLHDSLRDRLLPLPDDVEVLPAHGAGSLCGRSMSSELTSTMGAQRRGNPMLQPMTRERFVELLTEELPEQPRYFGMDVSLNRSGPAPIAHRDAPRALKADEVARLAEQGATILDVRTGAEYGAGHLPASVNIGLSGQLASWAGTLLPLDRPVVIVSSTDAQASEAQLRLARVGLENVAGVLRGGVAAWTASGRRLATTPQVTVQQLAAAESPRVLDVRRRREHVAGHVPGATNVPLDRLASEGLSLDRDAPLHVICQSGYRSSAALGLLEAMGFTNLRNVVGGTSAWREAGHPIAEEAGAACRI